MDEREFEFLGKVYTVVENDSPECGGCSFNVETEVGYCLDVYEEHPCLSMNRVDRKSVIFVEKKP